MISEVDLNDWEDNQSYTPKTNNGVPHDMVKPFVGVVFGPRVQKKKKTAHE